MNRPDTEPQVSLSRLMGSPVLGKDGTLGCIVDALCDEELFIVRYLVTRLDGETDPGRRVLLSRQVLSVEGFGDGPVQADVTRQEVLSSPTVTPEAGISREEQRSLHAHHGWTPYWQEETYQIVPTLTGETGTDLFQVTQVLGWKAKAAGGAVLGQVKDLSMSSATWAVTSVTLVVDDRDDPVLAAPHEILSFNPTRRTMRLDLPADCLTD